MITCPNCNNSDKKTMHQHDASLVGYKDYGRFFTCYSCKKSFMLNEFDATNEEIELFNGKMNE